MDLLRRKWPKSFRGSLLRFLRLDVLGLGFYPFIEAIVRKLAKGSFWILILIFLQILLWCKEFFGIPDQRGAYQMGCGSQDNRCSGMHAIGQRTYLKMRPDP